MEREKKKAGKILGIQRAPLALKQTADCAKNGSGAIALS